MNVLHVAPLQGHNSATGVTQSVLGLTAAQAAVGLKVALLPSLPLQERAIEEVPGLHLLRGPHQRQLNPWLSPQDWISRIREEFGTPDLVNFHSTYIPFHIALARRCRQVGWPYIITPHGGMTAVAQSVKKAKKSVGNMLFYRSFVKHAAGVHALSEFEAAQIRSLFGVKRVITVPNGVDDRLFDLSERLAAATLDSFGSDVDLMLGFVGRIDVYIKGIDLLLGALAKLKLQPGGLPCKLFLVGPFHTKGDRDRLLSVIQSHGLEDVVKLFGPKFGEEKWSYFLACDVYVQTSRTEGISMSILEAMALRRPCLVTPGTNMADVVRECGGWVCTADSDSIADTIRTIHKSRQSLPAIGQRLRDFVRSRFTWRNIAQQLSTEYAQIIEQHS